MTNRDGNVPNGFLVIGGLILGGAVGFLLRPSAFLVGQLPFEYVIAPERLTGLLELYKPTAELSRSIMLGGAIIGAAAGFVLELLLGRRRFL